VDYSASCGLHGSPRGRDKESSRPRAVVVLVRAHYCPGCCTFRPGDDSPFHLHMRILSPGYASGPKSTATVECLLRNGDGFGNAAAAYVT
jgi:hypothetical protein